MLFIKGREITEIFEKMTFAVETYFLHGVQNSEPRKSLIEPREVGRAKCAVLDFGVRKTGRQVWITRRKFSSFSFLGGNKDFSSVSLIQTLYVFSPSQFFVFLPILDCRQHLRATEARKGEPKSYFQAVSGDPLDEDTGKKSF